MYIDAFSPADATTCQCMLTCQQIEEDSHSVLIRFSRPAKPSAELPYPGTQSVKSTTLLELPRGSIAAESWRAVTKTEPLPLYHQIRTASRGKAHACSDLLNVSVKSGNPNWVTVSVMIKRGWWGIWEPSKTPSSSSVVAMSFYILVLMNGRHGLCSKSRLIHRKDPSHALRWYRILDLPPPSIIPYSPFIK